MKLFSTEYGSMVAEPKVQWLDAQIIQLIKTNPVYQFKRITTSTSMTGALNEYILFGTHIDDLNYN